MITLDMFVFFLLGFIFRLLLEILTAIASFLVTIIELLEELVKRKFDK